MAKRKSQRIAKFKPIRRKYKISPKLIRAVARRKPLKRKPMKGVKRMKGGGFWKDFGRGFKKGFTGAGKVALELAPFMV